MRKYIRKSCSHLGFLFQNELNEVVEQNKAAKSVISKMSPFFHTVEFVDNPEFDWGSILYADEAKVNITSIRETYFVGMSLNPL